MYKQLCENGKSEWGQSLVSFSLALAHPDVSSQRFALMTFNNPYWWAPPSSEESTSATRAWLVNASKHGGRQRGILFRIWMPEGTV